MAITEETTRATEGQAPSSSWPRRDPGSAVEEPDARQKDMDLLPTIEYEVLDPAEWDALAAVATHHSRGLTHKYDPILEDLANDRLARVTFRTKKEAQRVGMSLARRARLHQPPFRIQYVEIGTDPVTRVYRRCPEPQDEA